MEKPMKNRMTGAVTFGAIIALVAVAFGCCGGVPYANAQAVDGGAAGAANDAGVSGAIDQKPLLTPAQRSRIYAEVGSDKSNTSPKDFSTAIGAEVPPMIELYELPDDAVADVPAAKLYKYTMVNDRVVVVDPTRMRVIDVIGPTPSPQQ